MTDYAQPKPGTEYATCSHCQEEIRRTSREYAWHHAETGKERCDGQSLSWEERKDVEAANA
jgi:hypothetical protein